MAHGLGQPGALLGETVSIPLDEIEPATISLLHTVTKEALEGDLKAYNVMMEYIDHALEHVLRKAGRFVGESTHSSRGALKTILVTRLFAMRHGNFDPPKHPHFIAIESMAKYLWTFVNDRLTAREEEMAAKLATIGPLGD